MKRLPSLLLLCAALPLVLGARPMIPSSPELGKAEGTCRPGESGPALLVEAMGLKDRTGTMKLEVYPSNDEDFLADDNVLLSAGKLFRRVVVPPPPSGPVIICVRIPGPGFYSVSLLHDRNQDRKFNWKIDGIGFSGNPRLGWSKPRARSTLLHINSGGISKTQIVLNYKNGLGVAPLKQ